MTQHLKVQSLIPWFVNGSLDEQDMTTVNRHLDSCSQCKTDVSIALKQAQLFHSTDETIVHSLLQRESASLSMLERRIGIRRRAVSKPSVRSQVTPAVAAIVFTLAILGVTTTGWLPGGANQDLTFEAMTRGNDSDSVVLQMIFHPQTSEHDIRMLLLESGGELLGNPTPNGVYRLSFKDVDDATGYAARLRQQPSISWAEVER